MLHNLPQQVHTQEPIVYLAFTLNPYALGRCVTPQRKHIEKSHKASPCIRLSCLPLGKPSLTTGHLVHTTILSPVHVPVPVSHLSTVWQYKINCLAHGQRLGSWRGIEPATLPQRVQYTINDATDVLRARQYNKVLPLIPTEKCLCKLQ